MKRRRTTTRTTLAREGGGSFTGGTGDIKPAILTLGTGKPAGADDYATAQIAFPVPRFGTSKNKATITELLWVDWYMAIEDIGDELGTYAAFLSTDPNLHATSDTCTSATLALDIVEPSVFAYVLRNYSVTTSGGRTKEMPIRVDLTDSNGNGLLIATDRIAVYGGNIGGTTVGNYICKVAYRLVDVGIEEYVGILASQQ